MKGTDEGDESSTIWKTAALGALTAELADFSPQTLAGTLWRSRHAA
jgi:hypothetical protein